MTILGIQFDNFLNFQLHINETIKICSQSFFAMRTFKKHSLNETLLQNIFITKIMSKLCYAIPAWWGFTTKSCKDQLQSFLNRTVKFRYYKESDLTISEIADKTDSKLFNSIKDNSSHCLYKLLPSIKNINYSLR